MSGRTGVDLTGSHVKTALGLVAVAVVGWWVWSQAQERIPEPRFALDHGFERIAGSADHDQQDLVRCLINQIKQQPSLFGSEAGFELRPSSVVRPGAGYTVILATTGRIRQLELSSDSLALAGRATPIPTRCRVP